MVKDGYTILILFVTRLVKFIINSKNNLNCYRYILFFISVAVRGCLVMGCYRRLIYDAFRRKISPVESFFSRSNPTGSRISQPIFRMVKNKQRKSPNFFAKRFYSKVNHLTANKELGRWYENRRNLIRLGFLGCGATCVYYWNLETVPFTKRRHFVLVPTCLEKKFGDKLFEVGKVYKLKEKLVGSHHPDSIRVEKIGQDIIRGLLKGLGKTNEDARLEEFNWEFIVVDDPTIVNAACLPGGKILVFTGMLNYLKTDDEIANIIGHEVGHAVARHPMSGMIWLKILQRFMSDRFKRPLEFFIRLPLCRRYEIEADYIGLLVSACAGYDPRIAPQVCFKLEKYLSRSEVDDFWSTHPHEKKRAQLVSQPKVMEEALSFYREALKEKDKDKDKEEGLRGYLNFSNRFIGIFF